MKKKKKGGGTVLAGLGLLTLLTVTGCGKTVEQALKVGHDLLDVASKSYEDAKDNYEAAKKLVLPAEPGK